MGPDTSAGRDDADVDEAVLDLAASAALIDAQRERLAAATDVDGRLLFGVWGVAWLVGFGALYFVSGDDPVLPWSPAAAGVLFAALDVAAIVVTTVHIARRTAGLRGTSATQGAMYGWAWFLGFAAIGGLGYALGRAGASIEVISATMTIVPALLVGTLYIAGGAIWQDRTQFALGVWILLVTIVAALVGAPGLLAVMAVAGGGGMLVGGLAVALRRRREVAARPGVSGSAAP